MQTVIVDLSKLIRDEMEVYPSDPKVSIEVIKTIENDGWELRNINFGTHTGTHVDAFSHMIHNEKSIEDMPLNSFFGLARKVNSETLLPENRGLIFAEKTGIESLEKIITSKPKFVAGEIDENLQRELLRNNIITYTDLINLNKLPDNKEFMFYGVPLRIYKGDGSPVRAFAIYEDY